MQKQAFRTIQVEINQGNRATIAEARTDVDGEGVTASAEALRHPDDKNDPELGRQIATARALSSLANKLARRANGRVKMNDDNSRRASEQPSPRTTEPKEANNGN